MGLFGLFKPFGGGLSDGPSIGSGKSILNLFNDDDKGDKINEYRNEAEEYVEKGKHIYEKSKKKLEQVSRQTERCLRDHMDFKQRVSDELSGSTAAVIKEFRSFDIESRIKLPSVPRGDSSGFSLPNLIFDRSGIKSVSGIKSMFPQGPDPFMSLLTHYFTEKDYEKAREARRKARDYYDNVLEFQESVRLQCEKMKELQVFIGQERHVLESLMEKIRLMVGKLQSAMHRDSFTQEEADYLQSITSIIENMQQSISEDFLTDSGEVTQRYRHSLEQMEKLDQLLPGVPMIPGKSIGDLLRFLNKIERLKEY